MIIQGDEINDSLSFEKLLEDAEDYDSPERGNIRPAIILQINRTEILVDLGVKRDGIVPQADIERLPDDYLASLSVGDEAPVYVMNPGDRNGNLIVSLNLGLQGQDWVKAQKLLDEGGVVEAEVFDYNRGGVLVKFGRLEGFVPASHLAGVDQSHSSQTRDEAFADVVGTTIGLKVIEVNQSRRRLILSQREAQRDWRDHQKARLLDELSEGDIVTGRVTGIRDFGVFVDIGGADGLIHVSELAWHRVPHPRDVVEPGAEVQVYVLELDYEKQRIALSLRRLNDDPWQTVSEQYTVDQDVEGVVSNVVDFGAFVVLEDGIEGLLHLSEMADGTLAEPYSYLRHGDRIMVRIVRIEPDRKRIGFTQRGLDIELPAALSDDEGGFELDEREEPLAESETTDFEQPPIEPDSTISDEPTDTLSESNMDSVEQNSG